VVASCDTGEGEYNKRLKGEARRDVIVVVVIIIIIIISQSTGSGTATGAGARGAAVQGKRAVGGKEIF